MKVADLNPKQVFSIFDDITRIPRPSKKEEKIRQYLLDFAKKHNLEAKTDKVGNVLIKAPATPGHEQAPTVILQGHMDMVCESNDKSFNFETTPITTIVDGEWVHADGTTLGADNGIGVAASLAVMTDPECVHGPLEALFTMDEETYEINSNPIHVVWESSANFNFLGSPMPVGDIIKLLMVMPLLNDMSVTVPDMLSRLLTSVELREDGNIVANYMEDGETPATSSPNMVQYVIPAKNKMLVFINPQAVIAEDADSRSASRALDVNNLLNNILAQVAPMLSNGVPMATAQEGNALSVYMDTDLLLPLLKTNVLPLLRDEELVKQLVDMVASDPDMGMFAPMLPPMIASMGDVIEGTTKIEVGLNFTKAN